jgi:hypothetical protein
MVTLVLPPRSSNVTVVVNCRLLPSAAERDRVIKEYGADKGLVQTLSRLAEYLSTIG